MSRITYYAKDMTIVVEGMDDISKALGVIKNKTPAVAKTAINATAREARKMMIQRAKARYALNAAGREHLKKLEQRKRATNRSLNTELYIENKMQRDLGYFQSRPSRPLMGKDVAKAPEFFKGRVLKSSPMERLTGKGRLSKGFLVEFKSGHVGMVQRIEGTGKFHYTIRSGAPSWSDKMKTMPSPSETAMHGTVWPDVEPEVEMYLMNRMTEQVEKVLERARARARKG